MSYEYKANAIEGKIEELRSAISAVKSNGIESDWSGDTPLSLNNELDISVEKLETEVDKLAKYTSILRDVEEYKNNKEHIASLHRMLSSIPYSQENLDRITSLNSEIRSCTADNRTLRTKIFTALASFGTITAGNTDSISGTGSVSYSYDPDELIKIYNPTIDDLGNGACLTTIGAETSIYDLYNTVDASGNVIPGSGEAYVEKMLDQVQCNYTGRDAAVNSALTMLKLAADKNVRINYEHKDELDKAPYVETSEVASGIDNNPFASWVIDKGTPSGFQSRPISEYHDLGEAIAVENWSTAKPGDVFVSDNHVGIIVLNDPDNNLFITAESANGVEIRTRTYSQLQDDNFQIRDLSSVYNGTEDTNREEYKEHINWNTYENK